MTIGMNYATHYLNVPQGRVDLQIWDYGGQLLHRPIISKFLEGTSGALLMFDLTRLSTFQELEEWHIALISNLTKIIPILLVGCKDDICEQTPASQSVPDSLTKEVVKKNNYIDFIKTSAKSGKNIACCFEKVVQTLLDQHRIV